MRDYQFYILGGFFLVLGLVVYGWNYNNNHQIAIREMENRGYHVASTDSLAPWACMQTGKSQTRFGWRVRTTEGPVYKVCSGGVFAQTRVEPML